MTDATATVSTEGPATTSTAPAVATHAAPAPSTLLTAPPADPAKPADPATVATDPAKPAEAPKPAGAPEQYADFTLPEGVKVDATALANFSPALKALNLTQEQAQQLVTTYATETQRQATEFGTKLQDPAFAVEQAGLMLANHRDAWAAAIKADTEIGGANFDANVQTAQRALARFGTPELKSILETTGLGNHPALVKAFVAIGKQIREDSPNYGASTAGRKPTTEVLYANTGAGA